MEDGGNKCAHIQIHTHSHCQYARRRIHSDGWSKMEDR